MNMIPFLVDPPPAEEQSNFELILKHGHQDLVQAVAFNSYGDRCATGSVDGKIRVFNRHRDGVWRHCDNWGAHGGEILELQWLPPTIHPNLLASLGIEGRFKLWAEDPSAAPGRRFSNRAGTNPSQQGYGSNSNTNSGTGGGGGGGNAKAAFETRSSRHPFRSFSMRHDDATRHTHLALLAADGRLTIYENDVPENLADYAQVDEFPTLSGPPPPRGAETSFRVRFDPNPEPCYTALRAGVPADALSLVVAAMDTVRVYRTRDTVSNAYGMATSGRAFYLAAEIASGHHRGLVRDVSWAPGNIRGYDVIATACQDGFVRVFSLAAQDVDGRRSWAAAEVKKHAAAGKRSQEEDAGNSRTTATGNGSSGGGGGGGEAHSGIRAELSRSGANDDRQARGQPGQVPHVIKELSRLDSHMTPVWRVGFDDDGQILGSVGDEGRLLCYRQRPDGSWAKSAELGIAKVRMTVPP